MKYMTRTEKIAPPVTKNMGSTFAFSPMSLKKGIFSKLAFNLSFWILERERENGERRRGESRGRMGCEERKKGEEEKKEGQHCWKES